MSATGRIVSARLRSRKRFALVLALIFAVIPVAFAAQAAGGPAEMRFACAKKDGGLLRYVKRAGECRTSTERLIRFRGGDQVVACAHRGGYVYLVGKRAACKSERHAPSLTLRLPSAMENSFCANKQTGLLRSTRHAPYSTPRPRVFTSACRPDEKRVFVDERNRRPRAEHDSATVGEDGAGSIQVLANDSDPDGDALEVARVIPGTIRGSVGIAADRGSVSYDPSGRFEALGAGARATETFDYKVTDGRRKDRARVTVTVQGANDAPRAAADAGSTNEDAATTIAVLGNDSDVDAGDVLSVTAVDTAGTAGAVTINPGGTLRYNPAGRLDDLRAGEQRIDRFAYRISDGHGGTAGATVSVTVAGVNDAPVVTPSAGSATFTEGGSPVDVDAALGITDADSTQLIGATLAIVAGHDAANDELTFTPQPGISVDTTTPGTLSFAGAASVADYQAVIRSVRFRTGGANPSGATRTIRFHADDGTDESAPSTRDVNVATVNDAPLVTTSAGSAAFTEGGGPVAVDPDVTVSDVDSPNLAGATVDIGAGHDAANDVLTFTDTSAIDGSFDAASGTMTLTGTATATQYQAALRDVRFNNADDTPSTAARTVSFHVDDGASVDNLSNVATRQVTVAATNDAPVVTTSAGPASFTEDGPAVIVDGGLTVTDPDDSDLESATVSITGNFAAGQDTLGFTNTPSITGSYNAGTGVLTLTPIGTASVADFRAALRTVTYSNSSQDPSTAIRTVAFRANDGSDQSAPATRDVQVGGVNDAPVLGASGTLTYTENDSATAVAPAMTASDVDSANLTGATVEITTGYQNGQDVLSLTDQNGITGTFNTATGRLTLTGSASVANYQAALRDVRYANTSENPNATTRTISFQADDGQAANHASNTVTRDVNVVPVNDVPTVTTSSSSVGYVEGGPAVEVDSGLLVQDPDSNLVGAEVQVTTGRQTGDMLGFTDQNGITGNFNAATGLLTLTGTTTVANYQTALQSVTFSNSTSSPGGATRTVRFQVTDNAAASSADATRDVTVTEVNSAPVVTTSGGSAAFTEGGGAVAVDPSVTVTDSDSPNLVGGTVQITGAYDQPNDVLAFANTPEITGTFNAATGTMTLSGTATVAQYQAALRDVRFANADDTPSTLTRTVSFRVDDGASVDNLSNVATRQLTVTATNDAPVVTTSAGSPTYTEDGPAVVVDGAVSVTDADTATIASATVSITSSFAAGQDVLGFTDTSSIIGSYNAGTGVLTLTGPASVADFQAALRTVTYSNSSQDPSTTTRTVSFRANDGSDQSAPATRDVQVAGVNDAPVLGASGSFTYTENDPATAIAPALTATDVDSANLTGATVEITSGYQNGQDVLSLAAQNGITGTFNAATGLLTLTGSASVANYETALRDVRYRNTSEDPNASPRTISFQADDGQPTSNLSNTVTRDITVVPVNDAPVADDETFNNAQRAVGNTSLVVNDPSDGAQDPAGPQKTITGDILDGDTDVDGPGPLVITTGPLSSSDGGSVTIEADGDFTFQPKAGTSCTDHSDSFDYTISDQHATTPQTGTGTVTISIEDCVWYVDSSLATNGDGRSHTPFNALADLDGAGGAGDVDDTGQRIFLYDGSYSGGLPLENSQTLLGQRHGLTVADGGAGTLALEPAGGGNSTIAGGLVLGSGNTIQGIHLGNASGAALSGTTVGNAVMNTVTSGAIDNQTGAAVNINGGALNVAFTGVSSNNSGGVGIALNNVSGTFDADGGALANATGAEVSLTNGTSNFSYDGSISSSAGQAVSISGETGGTKDFNGSVSASGGSGISLTGNNAATTMRFDGGLALSTGTNAAFVATGGGTVAVTDQNPAGVAPDNTLATTTGTALNIANTTIHANGATFRSISSNGATNGIVLNNTGTSAGLTITGTGANNSGGTIQNATQHGVSLTSTNNFNADELSITGANFAGVDGTDVTNFTFTDGEIVNAGDSLTDPLHGAIAFNDQAGNENNVDGTLVVTGNTLKDHYGGGVDVFNRNGTLNDATVSNNTIDSPANEALSKEDAISFNLFGSASTVASLTKAQIEDNVITDHPSGNGITILGAQTNPGGAPVGTVGQFGSATNRILIDGNLLTGDPTLRFGGAAIQAGVEGRGQGNFDITNNGTVANPITNVGTHGIATGNSGSSTVEYLIQGNRVTANNFEGGGLGIRSASDDHIMVGGSVLATPTLRTIIDGNVVRNTTGGGIRVLAGNSNGTSEVKVTNNDVANGFAGTSGIDIGNGSSADAAFNPTMCATISGNTVAANAPSGGGNTFPGILLSKRFTTATPYQFGVTGGLTPSPAPNVITEAFLTGLNPNANLGGGFYSGKRVAVNVGDNFVSCTHPPGF
jgi:VCBS repeat-containing protein